MVPHSILEMLNNLGVVVPDHAGSTQCAKILPWFCECCENKWVDSLILTWEECPECGGVALHDSARELTDKDKYYR
ncbi:hypothetical protein M2277_005689 [Paenibacillus sp. LBL]|nr:hypothetical protein [Paenibacillus sp. LBL]